VSDTVHAAKACVLHDAAWHERACLSLDRNGGPLSGPSLAPASVIWSPRISMAHALPDQAPVSQSFCRFRISWQLLSYVRTLKAQKSCAALDFFRLPLLFSGCLYLKIFYFTKSYISAGSGLNPATLVAAARFPKRKISPLISLTTLICNKRDFPSPRITSLRQAPRSPRQRGWSAARQLPAPAVPALPA
jgi:hypothetical protein